MEEGQSPTEEGRVEQVPVSRERAASGDASVMRVTADMRRRMSVADEDMLRRIADPHQVRVVATLDNDGIRVKVVGNAHFGDEAEQGRDDDVKSRSMAAYTIEANDDDKQRVADLLSEIGSKYRARAIGGAMKSALQNYDPQTDSVVIPTPRD